MSERNPFDPHSKPAGSNSGHGMRRDLSCEEWEALLADALDGTLPAGEDRVFDEHAAACATCGLLLSQARDGRDWLEFLHPEPEMPSDLVDRILGKTSAATADRPLAVYGAPIAAAPGVLTMPARRFMPGFRAMDSRMMMTAAMAFFSIALTLNLAGIRVTNLRLADLTPASIQNNLTRQFFGAKTQVVRYYNSLRVVYEFESKMRELRQDETTEPSQPVRPSAGQDKPASEAQPPAANHHNGGKLLALPNAPHSDDALRGHPELASTSHSFPGADARLRRSTPDSGVSHHEVVALLALNTDQAEGSLA
ncbi:zf-HC2 domain-containing protein [Silvibacterium sp.]|uniref:zf-HC2 domain-containing protein n=1 Tax=Silvibacterium sp. TaxID=1964179 RepID=UPI0039E41448